MMGRTNGRVINSKGEVRVGEYTGVVAFWNTQKNFGIVKGEPGSRLETVSHRLVENGDIPYKRPDVIVKPWGIRNENRLYKGQRVRCAVFMSRRGLVGKHVEVISDIF